MISPLAASLFGACLTVGTLLLGKWIDGRHKQTDVLREKLESFFRSLDSLMQSAWHPKYPDLADDASDARKSRIFRVAWHDQQQRLTSAVMECQVLGEIYFPSLKAQIDELLRRTKRHIDWMSEIGEDGCPLDMDAGNKSFGELNLMVAALKEHIISEQRYLTRAFPHWFEDY
jgi:hypothetical protein